MRAACDMWCITKVYGMVRFEMQSVLSHQLRHIVKLREDFRRRAVVFDKIALPRDHLAREHCRWRRRLPAEYLVQGLERVLHICHIGIIYRHGLLAQQSMARVSKGTMAWTRMPA